MSCSLQFLVELVLILCIWLRICYGDNVINRESSGTVKDHAKGGPNEETKTSVKKKALYDLSSFQGLGVRKHGVGAICNDIALHHQSNEMGSKHVKGMLLYGPAGTDKNSHGSSNWKGTKGDLSLELSPELELSSEVSSWIGVGEGGGVMFCGRSTTCDGVTSCSSTKYGKKS
ncbi:hypothetical protein V6N12_063671 [Hibiscus sabdariffa]|uniref:Uncharacterized protein n=1 Tax=Hibiscus sabdariffa TaxID=183260 RepID=A0ABR2FCH7_9ROSI